MKFWLLGPAVAFCALFVLWPLGEVFWLSLNKSTYIVTEFIGLANYARAFASPAFLRSVLNSLFYVVLVTTLQIGIALIVTLLAMDLRKKWHDAVRIVFYVPMLSAGIIIAQVWRWVFHFNGPLNWMLGTEVAWFAQASTGIPAIAMIVSATGIGGAVIVFLASILAIDKSLFDAAVIDGAHRWQIKLHIVIPMIAPAIGAMSLLSAIMAPQVFETIYALAPYEYTATMTFRIYQDGFQSGRYGLAAAEAVVLLVFVLGLSVLKNRIQREA